MQELLQCFQIQDLCISFFCSSSIFLTFIFYSRQALIEGSRLDHPAYATTLLTRSPRLYDRLARIIAQLTRPPSSQDCLAPTSTMLVQLPNLHNRLVRTITQLARPPSLHDYLARIITQLIGSPSSQDQNHEVIKPINTLFIRQALIKGRQVRLPYLYNYLAYRIPQLL